MKQTARIISTYAGDTSGVCSALFELGGMTVMHDASGCNSTYNTHDEPRWYDHDSLVFISALTETEAILGDERKLIDDTIRAARELSPAFVALAGSPIPMMTGVDLEAAARRIEEECGVPAFGFDTDGMHAYTSGASKAFAAVARRFVDEQPCRTDGLSVNLLGLTPLDFSVTGTERTMRRVLAESGIATVSAWAMGSTLDEIGEAAKAHVNLVVSSSGLGAAKVLRQRFGIPAVIGTPCGRRFNDRLIDAIRQSAEDGEDRVLPVCDPEARRIVIGEGVTAASLAAALTAETGIPARAICATDGFPELRAMQVPEATDEDDLIPLLEGTEVVIADPLYLPIVPDSADFVSLPHEGFSGRIRRRDIPDLAEDLTDFLSSHHLL
ncbi:MAG: oxidoreductase [Clostridia bacterium]|nr:oxidoreductase [Clostridia bacterium]